MRHWLPIAVVLAPVLWMIGCSESLTPTPRQNPGTAVQPNPSSPPAAPHQRPRQARRAVRPAFSRRPRRASRAGNASSTGGACDARTAAAGRCRAVVDPALGRAWRCPRPAQGTLMSFSVDYEFVQGEPSPEGYVWVIERAHGNPARQSVKLSKQGNLPILIQGWRPRGRPFPDASRRPQGQPAFRVDRTACNRGMIYGLDDSR